MNNIYKTLYKTSNNCKKGILYSCYINNIVNYNPVIIFKQIKTTYNKVINKFNLIINVIILVFDGLWYKIADIMTDDYFIWIIMKKLFAIYIRFDDSDKF